MGKIVNIGSRTDRISTQTDSNSEELHVKKIETSRSSACLFFIIGFLGLYSFSVSRYLLIQQELSLSQYGDSATLRRCVESAGGLWTPEDNLLTRRLNTQKKNVPVDYRVLCTSVEKRIAWGSYKLRCNDLKRWVDVCVPNVDMTVGVSLEYLHERWSNKPNATTKSAGAQFDFPIGIKHDIDMNYDATIFIKSMSKKPFPQFGKKFVDVVDEYNWKEENIPSDVHLILQTEWQGELMYPNHNSSVVEHWYNSYPSDMVTGGYPEYIPSINQKSPRQLHIATIWNTRRSHDPSEGGCPTLSISGVKYDCVDKVSVTLWVIEVVQSKI